MLALEKAAELDKDLGIDPARESRRLVADARRIRAASLAGAGNVEAAEVQLRRALKLDESLTFDLKTEARRLAAPYYRQQARASASRLDIESAVALFRQAAASDPSFPINQDGELRSAFLSKVEMLVLSGKIQEGASLMKSVEKKL